MSVAVASTAPADAKPQPATELLFQRLQVGRHHLRNRIVMAPLTRSRSRQPGNVPTALNACYYVQRASAALIISEATQVSMQGQGYAWTPGIHSREQIEGWRLVTEAVHQAGGLIFLQLWHVGRISHPSLQPDGMLPVAPSAIQPSGQAFIMQDDDPETTFGTAAARLSDRGLAYLHLVNPALAALENHSPPEPAALRMVELLRAQYRGKLIVAGGFDLDTAEAWLRQGRADLIAFGRKFLANPDLPERFRLHAPLHADDQSTYYGGGAKGYTDYPTLAQERGEQPRPCVDDRWR